MLNKIARDGIFYGKSADAARLLRVTTKIVTLGNILCTISIRIIIIIIISKTLLIREKKKGKEVEGEEDRNRRIKFP